MAENALRRVIYGQMPDAATQVRRGVDESAEELGRLFVSQTRRETTGDDRCVDRTYATKTVPRARTNGRGGPGAYTCSMAQPPATVKPSGPPDGGGSDSEIVTRAPAQVPESQSRRRLRLVDLRRSVADFPFFPEMCVARGKFIAAGPCIE